MLGRGQPWYFITAGCWIMPRKYRVRRDKERQRLMEFRQARSDSGSSSSDSELPSRSMGSSSAGSTSSGKDPASPSPAGSAPAAESESSTSSRALTNWWEGVTKDQLAELRETINPRITGKQYEEMELRWTLATLFRMMITHKDSSTPRVPGIPG